MSAPFLPYDSLTSIDFGLHLEPGGAEANRFELAHAFTLRRDGKEKTDSEAIKQLFEGSEIEGLPVITAEQVHDKLVAVVDHRHVGMEIPAVDALVTNTPGIAICIRVADCGPLALVDPDKQVIAVTHSGKKGTQANILEETLNVMAETFGTNPEDVIVELGPCVRPPHYDLDFAQTICEQAQANGIGQYTDSGYNTGADLDRFYSYRVEKGQTGRHFLGLAIKRC